MSELLLMCRIAGHRIAMPALRVRSVIDIDGITPVPRAPAHVAGLTALRSEPLTVIDCRRALGLAPDAGSVGVRAAVVDHEGHSYALLVEEASEVEEAAGEPEMLPGGFGEGWARIADGLVETSSGPALVVSPEKLIAGPPEEPA